MKKILTILILSCSFLSNANDIDSLLGIWDNKSNEDTIRIEALHDASWKMLFINQDSAHILAQIEYQFAENINDLKSQIAALNTSGISFILKDELLPALNYFRKAITLAEYNLKSKDSEKIIFAKKGLAQTYINQGILYKNQGDYSNALKNQLNAVKLWEELGVKKNMATAYGNIGVIYKHLKEYDSALKYQRKSVITRVELHDQEGLALAYSNMGNVFKAMNSPDSAMYYYQQSLEISIDEGMNHSVATVYGDMGTLNTHEGNYLEAINFQEKSLALSIKNKSKKGTASSYIYLGEIYLKIKDFNKAINFLKKGLDIANNIGAVNLQELAHKYLSETYEALGQNSKALDNYKKYIEIKDSLFNDKTNREIARTEIKFQFDQDNLKDSLLRVEKNRLDKIEQDKKDAIKESELKQEKQNLIFVSVASGLLFLLLIMVIIQSLKQKKNNVILTKQKIKIEKSDKEKEILIREIHHRVKNNLQIISSLLKGEQRKSENEEVKNALSYSRQRIEAISFIHEKLYQQTDLSDINIEDYLYDIADNLLFSYGKNKIIEFLIESNLKNVNADIAVNIGFLTAELITNSIKHGYHKDLLDFSIQIKIINRGEHISFEYSDSGKKELQGINLKQSESFGNKLIYSLIKKLNGNINTDHKKDKGFYLCFDFKLKLDE